MPHTKRRCGKRKEYRHGSYLAVKLDACKENNRRTIAQNLADGAGIGALETSKGYRLSSNGKADMTRARMPFTKFNFERKGKKTVLQDNDLYTEKLDRTGGSKQQAQIRIGTTPSHMVPMLDVVTGDTRLVRVQDKPRYGVVGERSSVPKDGGKGLLTNAEFDKLTKE